MKATRKTLKQHAIEEQLFRVDHFRELLTLHRYRLADLEKYIREDVEAIERAKRELYQLGWKG